MLAADVFLPDEPGPHPALVAMSPYGLAGPHGLPDRIVTRLHDAFRRAMFDPPFIQELAKYDQQLRPIRDENDPRRLSLQGNRAQEEARKAELSHRLKVRLEEIEQESHLSEKPPEVLGSR